MKELTQQQLLQYGIKVKVDSSTESGYSIMRYGRNKNSNVKSYKPLAICKNGTYHPYSNKVKYYYLVSFSYNGKTVSIPLARLVYAYFIGDIPAGMDVDHINNDSLDNTFDNLQLLTRKDNIAKRTGFKNQYQAKKYVTSPEMREAFEKLLTEGE